MTTRKIGLLIGKGGLYGNVARIFTRLMACDEEIDRPAMHIHAAPGDCAGPGESLHSLAALPLFPLFPFFPPFSSSPFPPFTPPPPFCCPPVLLFSSSPLPLFSASPFPGCSFRSCSFLYQGRNCQDTCKGL